jgi:hypothetical protein
MMAVAGVSEQPEKTKTKSRAGADVLASKTSETPLAVAPRTTQDKTRSGGATPMRAPQKQPQQQADTRRGQATGTGNKEASNKALRMTDDPLCLSSSDSSVKTRPVVQERQETAGKKTLLWAGEGPGRAPLRLVRSFWREECIEQTRARRHAAEAARSTVPRRGAYVRKDATSSDGPRAETSCETRLRLFSILACISLLFERAHDPALEQPSREEQRSSVALQGACPLPRASRAGISSESCDGQNRHV